MITLAILAALAPFAALALVVTLEGILARRAFNRFCAGRAQ